MKIAVLSNINTKTIKIPNWIFVNRLGFAILKCFLVKHTPVLFGVKYKHIRPAIAVAKDFKGCEIVTVQSHNGYVVKVFL